MKFICGFIYWLKEFRYHDRSIKDYYIKLNDILDILISQIYNDIFEVFYKFLMVNYSLVWWLE